MILVIGGIKGGSGKTTLCTNLAVLLSLQNSRVLLVDSDDQKSTSNWADVRCYLNQKNENDITTVSLGGRSLATQLIKMKKDYDHIIVDSGGRETITQRSALLCADKYLVPFKPRSIDIWTIGAVKGMYLDILTLNPLLKCFFVINQADPKGSDNQIAKEALSKHEEMKCLPNIIVNRKAFSNAAAEGLGVHELPSKDEKACNEIYKLYQNLFSQ